ncbi:uncharacterized protein LOC131210180 [Anopheles bellator]|uniref:uncharacterized protein LOC131210180 n=1 Tax=Anopheles bellator TaxID=139047 RepID=UPI002649D811|nr:uncharacterized protein LOC131210180 [Anopheles bellator]
MDRELEVRHMASYLDTLANILDTSDGWRDFLYLIPQNMEDLTKDEYTPKYTGAHEATLETESARNNLSPAKLLLIEWSISGRIRPTVGDLLTLLLRANQIRAAEYLTNLLKETPPVRPKEGPGAPIDITLPEDHQTESLLDDISYPNSSQLQKDLSITIANNRDYYDKMGPMKRVEIKDTISSVADATLQQQLSISNNNTQSDSDSSDIRNSGMAEKYPELFPGPSGMKRRPIEPAAVNSILSDALPMVSILGLDENQSEKREESTKLQNDRKAGNMQNEDDHNNHQSPNLSIFGLTEEEVNVSRIDQQSEGIPALSALLAGPSDSQSTGFNDNTYAINDPPMSGTDSSTSSSAEGCTNGINHSSSGSPIRGTGSKKSQELSNAQNMVSNESNGDLIQFSSSPVLAEYSYELLELVTDNFNSKKFTNGVVQSPDGRWIGAGGFGAVFLGVNLAPTIPVSAVKRLESNKYKYREKFQLELDILSKHSHPNIVSLLGYCSNGPQLCLVYEYMNDGSLEMALAKVRENKLAMDGVCRLKYLQNIANAIKFLHERANVIHRDVKSANVLLNGSVAKLGDLGLLKSTTSMTTTKIIGTNAYMAPEAVRGDVTVALDVFAFGIVIAETVTGEPVLAENGSRSEIDLAGYILRHRAEGRNLALLVDRRASKEADGGKWLEVGNRLLETALQCMEARWCRPTSDTVAKSIDTMQLALSY